MESPSPSAALILLIFLVAWVFVCFFASRLSGWNALAAEYRATSPFSGQRWRLQSAELYWIGYNSCLVVGAGVQGLYLAAFPPFRIGHPPLLIPWRDLSIVECRHWLFGRRVGLRARRAPSVSITISRRLSAKIAAAAGAQWPLAAQQHTA